MGDDSELLPIPYSHSIDADTVIESQACFEFARAICDASHL